MFSSPKTKDKLPSAHFEHSIAITSNGPEILSKLDGEKPVFTAMAITEAEAGSDNSAIKCSAVLDVVEILDFADQKKVNEGQQLLHRIVSMLSKMCIN